MFYYSFMYGGTNFGGGVSILLDFSFKNGATNFFGDENFGLSGSYTTNKSITSFYFTIGIAFGDSNYVTGS